ncbi:MAG: thrombospondin type 3 repeat-containing protein [Verrucomicrobiales bacterium]|nr:thrombospondin type 3 repeat-containing protein [Verrucomicrobiales bacterium]
MSNAEILFEATWDGAGLLNDSSIIFPTRTPILNGNSLDFNEGDFNLEMLLEIPLVPANSVNPLAPVVVTTAVNFTRRTSDFDPGIHVNDGGINHPGFLVADNAGGSGEFGNPIDSDGDGVADSNSGFLLFSFAGYPSIGGTLDASVVFSLTDASTHVEGALNSGSGSADGVDLDRSGPLSLSIWGNHPEELYRINSLTVRVEGERRTSVPDASNTFWLLAVGATVCFLARSRTFAAGISFLRISSMLLFATLWTTAGKATTYDPEADFSIAANPNGSWSYGWSAELGAAFDLSNEGALGDLGGVIPIEYWQRSPQGYPKLFHNPADGPITFENLSFPEGSINFHPGADGALSIVRWTAPSASSISVVGQFMSAEALGWPPTTSDVHILKNGTSLFDNEIHGNVGVSLPFSINTSVVAGDTIDFAVGWGANHDYGYDNTALSARIVSTSLDTDGDEAPDDSDNCPSIPNPDQLDYDGDALGDVCDSCPFDSTNDVDNDGICGDIDSCPATFNPDQSDLDGDGIGDACDQDVDGDAVGNTTDNCPFTFNPDQADLDMDGVGDACDTDIDGDGVLDENDQCPATGPGQVVSEFGCSINDLCPCDNPWKNHGGYVSCVAHTAEIFFEAGLVTEAQKDAIVAAAAESDCGTKK